MSKYFTDREFKCRCGQCDGSNHMDDDLVMRLDDLREAHGKPIILSSAYRCPEYNNRVSSTGLDGPHTTGKAVDIAVYGQDAHRIVKIAMRLGFTGVGIKQRGSFKGRFIHLDIMPMGDLRPRIWSY